jgi:hypothetical protein
MNVKPEGKITSIITTDGKYYEPSRCITQPGGFVLIFKGSPHVMVISAVNVIAVVTTYESPEAVEALFTEKEEG